MSAMASSADTTGFKMFSGGLEDAKEYRRWKVWVTNKLLTLSDKVPETARGAYVYTLLAGKALECVEHLDPATYQKKEGEKVLWIRDFLRRTPPMRCLRCSRPSFRCKLLKGKTSRHGFPEPLSSSTAANAKSMSTSRRRQEAG